MCSGILPFLVFSTSFAFGSISHVVTRDNGELFELPAYHRMRAERCARGAAQQMCTSKKRENQFIRHPFR